MPNKFRKKTPVFACKKLKFILIFRLIYSFHLLIGAENSIDFHSSQKNNNNICLLFAYQIIDKYANLQDIHF